MAGSCGTAFAELFPKEKAASSCFVKYEVNAGRANTAKRQLNGKITHIGRQ
jgi:hypothetical protein